jgi:hypothetical protein
MKSQWRSLFLFFVILLLNLGILAENESSLVDFFEESDLLSDKKVDFSIDDKKYVGKVGKMRMYSTYETEVRTY